MFMKKQPAYRWCAMVLLAMTAFVSASAQYNNPSGTPEKNAGNAKLHAQLVKTGLYLISGAGGNCLLRLSGNGSILVDGELPGDYDAFLKLVRKISDQPIRALIVTDPNKAHIDNSVKFLAPGMRIVAQKNLEPGLLGQTSSGDHHALPIITYDREYKLQLGGVEAQLLHFGNAHSNGDTMVYFPNLKVVSVGSLFAPVPNPDYSAGGSLVSWGPVLGQILKLDFDVVVPATGPMVTRADLEAFKSKIDTLVSRATLLVRKGVSKDQLMAQLKTDDLGWRLDFTGGQLDGFLADLSQLK
jgi:cyclase